MNERRGEKNGWVFGWSGGFLWLVILAVVFAVQGRLFAGAVSLGLATLAFLLILELAPWKRPRTRYWKLMLPLYVVFIVSIVVTLWGFGYPERSGFSPWSLLWLSAGLVPFGTVGARTWSDSAG